MVWRFEGLAQTGLVFPQIRAPEAEGLREQCPGLAGEGQGCGCGCGTSRGCRELGGKGGRGTWAWRVGGLQRRACCAFSGERWGEDPGVPFDGESGHVSCGLLARLCLKTPCGHWHPQGRVGGDRGERGCSRVRQKPWGGQRSGQDPEAWGRRHGLTVTELSCWPPGGADEGCGAKGGGAHEKVTLAKGPQQSIPTASGPSGRTPGLPAGHAWLCLLRPEPLPGGRALCRGGGLTPSSRQPSHAPHWVPVQAGWRRQLVPGPRKARWPADRKRLTLVPAWLLSGLLREGSACSRRGMRPGPALAGTFPRRPGSARPWQPPWECRLAPLAGQLRCL